MHLPPRKNIEILNSLRPDFGEHLHLSRLKLLSQMIMALCRCQIVTLSNLGSFFDTDIKLSSNVRRLQRFLSSDCLCKDLVAKYLFGRLSRDQESYQLSIDRTNWKFGCLNINILMLGVVREGTAFPILFTLLNKRGNSNSEERIDLINRFVKLFGRERIDAVLADREFVGQRWIQFLNQNQIRYHIRIRNNFKVFLPRKNHQIKASLLFSSLPIHHFKAYHKIVKINNEYCYISGCKLKNSEYLIIMSYNKPQQAQLYYKNRWQIEMTFKAFKSSGFDLEKTHLKELKRIQNLILVIMIAFAWCYNVGNYIHQKIEPIKTKKNGIKKISIFKYGLNYSTR